MIALVSLALFLVMLFQSLRMAKQRGRAALTLFLGLISSALAFVLLVVAPLASSPALQSNRPLMAIMLLGAGLLYAAVMILFIRRMAAKMKSEGPPS